MISVLLDESYVFDMLSIYQIKTLKSPENPVHRDNFNRLCTQISLQLGREKTNIIIQSDEYVNLVSANRRTFDLVDAVKTNPCLGKEVDDSNYFRYLKKAELQNKFFNSLPNETKIGY